MADVVLYEVSDGVATVTINRPERMNALTTEVLEKLPDALRRAAADRDVRVVVLTGTGERAFSAGADLGAVGERNPIGPDVGLEESIDTLQRQQDVSYLLHTMPKPTIAAINGAAAGASLSMALACDLRLAVDEAVLRTAFSGIGFSGDYGGSYFLTHLVGSGRARELMLLGERLSARDALGIGLVNGVADPVLDKAREVAALLASKSPIALRLMKELANRALGGEHARNLEAEGETFGELFGSEDAREGLAAFVEKREPTFRGR